MSTRARKAKQPRTRKHAFGGCGTCRRRHVKCDHARPFCLACLAVGAVCEGYSSNVRWMPQAASSASVAATAPGTEDRNSNDTRRYLYSDESRASMSTSLVDKLGSNSVDGLLAELDARTKDTTSIVSAGLAIGPFGVLNLNLAAPVEHTSNDSNMNTTVGVVDAIPEFQTNTPSLFGTFDPILSVGDTLQWADLFELDFESIFMTQELMDGVGVRAPDTSVIRDPTLLNNYDQSAQPANPPLLYEVETQSRNPNPSTEIEFDSSPDILLEPSLVQDTQYLLKHFQDLVVPQMAFMPGSSKSPWTTLNLPEAVRTLAAMTYLDTGNLTHASAANFYAVVGCSAYNLSAHPTIQSDKTADYWRSIVTRCSERAKKHLQFSLRHELAGTRKAKYKDQLMAVLSMLAFASVSGNQGDARCFMVDAERLLRVKGLAKREISRKARFLHHVYTWIRIVGESTSVLHDYSSCTSVVDKICAIHRSCRSSASSECTRERSQSQTGHNARLDDFLRLNPHSSDSDLNIDEAKEHDVGLHDIHLEDSRHSNDTLFQVYGISETWLSLVSQTTRLANILEASTPTKAAGAAFFEFLQKRARRLEDIICSFALKAVPGSGGESSTCPKTAAGVLTDCQEPSNHMLRALNAALVILFYRRVRNVNPLILQGYVDHVVQALQSFDVAMANRNSSGPGTPWPAFIAGCEAISVTHRKALLSWLEKGFSQSGLCSFSTSIAVVKEVWHQQDVAGKRSKDSTSRTSSTWVDFSRTKKLWVMLF